MFDLKISQYHIAKKRMFKGNQFVSLENNIYGVTTLGITHLRNLLSKKYCSHISRAKKMPKQNMCQTIIAKPILPLRRCRCK